MSIEHATAEALDKQFEDTYRPTVLGDYCATCKHEYTSLNEECLCFSHPEHPVEVEPNTETTAPCEYYQPKTCGHEHD